MCQGGIQTLARALVTDDPQLVLRVVGWNEKGKPLNVVPVRVGDQQRQFDRLVLELLCQRQTEPPNAAPGVEDDDLAVGADLDAGSVPAVLNGARAGRGDRAAHPPEFESRRL